MSINEDQSAAEDFGDDYPINGMDIMKKELYENFRETGILDSLKADLRKSVAARIQSKSMAIDRELLLSNKENMRENMQTLSNPKDKPYKKILDSIVADYLYTQKYSFTYSVFLPETEKPSELIWKQELFELFQIKSDIFKQSTENQMLLPRQESLLERIYNVLVKPNKLELVNHHTQTDPDEDQREMKIRMRNIEEEYLKKADYLSLGSAKSAEEALIKHRREAEARYKSQLELEVARIRDYEMNAVRRDEQSKYQRKLLDYKKELEQDYQDRLKKLKDREREALDLCKKKMSELERQAFEQRQELLKEIETVKEKENELRRHNCNESESLKREKERIKELEKELRMKIREYDDARKALQVKLEEDIGERRKAIALEEKQSSNRNLELRRELEAEKEFIKNQRESLSMLEKQRGYLSRENESLQGEVRELEYTNEEQRKEIYALRESVKNLREANEKLEMALEVSDKRVGTLAEENAFLKESLRDCQEALDKKNAEHINFLRIHTQDMSRYQEKLESIEAEKAYIVKSERERATREHRKYEENLERMENRLKSTWEINASLRKEQEASLARQIVLEDDKFFSYRKNLNQIYEEIEKIKKEASKELDVFGGNDLTGVLRVPGPIDEVFEER